MTKKQQLNQFVAQHIDESYRLAYVYTKNRADAEDIVSESVVKALRKIGALKNPDAMKPWFFKIVVNTALTHLKKQSAGKVVYAEDFAEDSSDFERVVWDDYSNLYFDDMLELLPAEERVVVALRFLEERQLNEIAEILEVNENTVKTRLYRALRRLRAELSEKEGAL